MERGPTGRFDVTRVGGEEIRAFVSKPLPPEPPLELSGGRQRLLERAMLALGRLDSITTLLPDPQRFFYAYVRREAVLSSQIEGAQSSLSDLLLNETSSTPRLLPGLRRSPILGRRRSAVCPWKPERGHLFGVADQQDLAPTAEATMIERLPTARQCEAA